MVKSKRTPERAGAHGGGRLVRRGRVGAKLGKTRERNRDASMRERPSGDEGRGRADGLQRGEARTLKRLEAERKDDCAVRRVKEPSRG